MNNQHKVQVILALIGLVGVILTGVLANWDKLFYSSTMYENKKPDNNVHVDINKSLVDKAYTDLKIIDFINNNDSFEFKLKNSGTDSAFLTDFILFMKESPNSRIKLGLKVGSADYELKINTSGKSYNNSDKRLQDESISDAEYYLRKHYGHSLNNTNGVGPISLVKISQVVPPRGVDSFKINIKFIERIDGVLPEELTGIILIKYDNNNLLATGPFNFKPNYLK